MMFFINILNLTIYFSIFILTFQLLYINNISFDSSLCVFNRLLVSGASESHGNLIILMLYQIINLETDLCFVLWDLGLNLQQLKIVNEIINYIQRNKTIRIVIFYHYFNFTKFPFYFNIQKNSGEYAWKPVIIFYTYNKYRKPLFWLDAGCFINGSLLSVYEHIKNKQIWSISTKHTIKKYTHSHTLQYLNVSSNIQNQIMCTGGVVGFYYPSSLSLTILNTWKECALNRECIAPNGSNRKNHRQDQSVLSIFLYKNNIYYNCKENMNYNFSIQFDVKIKFYKNKDFSDFKKKILHYH